MDSKVKKLLDENNIKYYLYNLSTKDNKEYHFEIPVFGEKIKFIEYEEGVADLQSLIVNEYIKDFNIKYVLDRAKERHITKPRRLSRQPVLRMQPLDLPSETIYFHGTVDTSITEMITSEGVHLWGED